MTIIEAIDEGYIPKRVTSEVGVDFHLQVKIGGDNDRHFIELWYEAEFHSLCKDVNVPIGDLPTSIDEAVYRLQQQLANCPNVDTETWEATGRLQTNHPLVQ
jgi:hypothetical protein